MARYRPFEGEKLSDKGRAKVKRRKRNMGRGNAGVRYCARVAINIIRKSWNSGELYQESPGTLCEYYNYNYNYNCMHACNADENLGQPSACHAQRKTGKKLREDRPEVIYDIAHPLGMMLHLMVLRLSQ